MLTLLVAHSREYTPRRSSSGRCTAPAGNARYLDATSPSANARLLTLVRLKEALRPRRVAQDSRAVVRCFDHAQLLSGGDFPANARNRRHSGARLHRQPPRCQNRYLRELCGLKDPHRKLGFPGVIGRVENELEFADLILTPSRFVAGQLEAIGLATTSLLSSLSASMCSPSVRTPCIPRGRPRELPGPSLLVRSHIERARASFLRLRAGCGTGVSSSSWSGRLSDRRSSMECRTAFAIEGRASRRESHGQCGTPISSCCHRSRMRSVW
jgi:hypothetical protein